MKAESPPMTPAASKTVAAPPPGFRTWLVIWFGQFVSVIGTELTAFALGVWAFRETGSVTSFTLIMVFAQLPIVVLVPFAGALVDRWDRRRTLMAANGLGAATMIGLALLIHFGVFQFWHIYPAIGLVAVANAFHWPAFAAVPALIVRKSSLGRAAGMVELANATAKTIAPGLATLLVEVFLLAGVVLVDAATFLIALGALTLVRIPRPPAGQAGGGPLWPQVRAGWDYLTQRPALVRLLLFFMSINIFFSFPLVLAVPLVASFATGQTMAVTLSVGAAGLLVGGVVMSLWGGPKRKAHGVVGTGTVLGLSTLLAGLRPSPVLVACSLFVLYAGIPVMNGCSQAIWQSKVAPELQGRVFALRRMLATITAPVGFLSAGLLADKVFNPFVAGDSGLAEALRDLIGGGAGRGIGLLFVLVGLACVGVGIGGFCSRKLMNIDTELPDAIPHQGP